MVQLIWKLEDLTRCLAQPGFHLASQDTIYRSRVSLRVRTLSVVTSLWTAAPSVDLRHSNRVAAGGTVRTATTTR